MKKLILGGAVGSALLVFGSCTTTQKATLSDLTGEWNIVKVDGKNVDIPETLEQPYVGFDTKNGHVFGNAGCNSVFGSFDTESPDGSISLAGMGSTRMGCPDMTLEQSILNAFGKVDQYRLTSSGDMELCADGKAVLLLQKREPALSGKDLAGEWTITEISGNALDEEVADGCTIMFDSAQSIFGCTTDCNTIGGSYQSEFVDLTMNVATSTMMACPDSSVEDQLKALLPQVTSFGELAGGGIGLYSSDGQMLVVLARK